MKEIVILPVQCSSPQADPRVKMSNDPGHGMHEGHAIKWALICGC